MKACILFYKLWIIYFKNCGAAYSTIILIIRNFVNVICYFYFIISTELDNKNYKN